MERGSVSVSPALQRRVIQASTLLKAGKVVAFPTDTVYGVGADAFSSEGVERIYRLKGRDRDKPLQLLLQDSSFFPHVAAEVPELAWRLADRFLPGGLSLILKKGPQVPDAVTAGKETVAVRVVDHPLCQLLLQAFGGPLAASSANRSGKPSPVTAAEVWSQLGQEVELILDGGPCPLGMDSTIIDLTGPQPRILREGAIPRALIQEICPVGD